MGTIVLTYKVITMAGDKVETQRGFFDLKKQYIFYASYHNNPVNVAIHLFCIWNIVWSALVLLHLLPAFMEAPALLAKVPYLGGLPVNLALLVTFVYVVTYINMDPVAGSIGAILMIYLNKWTWGLAAAGEPVLNLPLWQAVAGFHVFMWIVQFIGHGVFEKRAPALLDSWDQAFITAPLFVILEVLFFFGYRKQFYQDCMKEVEMEIKKFRANKTQ